MSSDESMRNKSKVHQYLRINSPLKEPVVHLSPEYLKPLSPLTIGRAMELRVAAAVGNIISNENHTGINDYKLITSYFIIALNFILCNCYVCSR